MSAPAVGMEQDKKLDSDKEKITGWVNVIRNKASWSWVSLPSLFLVWMLVAIPFESYILPQPWEVADEAWNEMMFPTVSEVMDDDGEITIIPESERPSFWKFISKGEANNALKHLFRGELWPHVGWSLLEEEIGRASCRERV